jgi:Cu(I)/Ag(I) efflux system protein CusF
LFCSCCLHEQAHRPAVATLTVRSKEIEVKTLMALSAFAALSATAISFLAPSETAPANGEKVAQAGSHKATGIVKKVDAAGAKVALRHEPIQSIGWPAMTRAFAVKDKQVLQNLKPDQKVEFDLVKQGPDYVITPIK